MHRILALALVVALASACSATVIPGHPVRSTIESNATSSANAPELPDVAMRHTHNGATAFARYYFAAIDWALAASDLRTVRQVTEPRCEGCDDIYQLVRNIPATDASYVVDSAEIAHPDVPMAAEIGVDVGLHVDPGASPQSVGNDPFHVLLCMNWHSSGWMVDQLWSY